MNNTTEFDVIVVGAGLAGLSLACALRDLRLRVALVEQRVPQRPPGWDARVYALSPANAAFLQEIGVWEHLPGERVAPIHAMAIHGDSGAQLLFSAYESGIAELGWVLESSLMACALWEKAARQANLELCCPAVPQALSIRAGGAVLTLADGARLSARLLIGADGRDSWVRQALALPAISSDYGEMGVVANIECERTHGGSARQWFRADGVLAWLPLAGNRVSIVWSTPEENAKRLLAMSGEDFCAEVAAAGRHELGGFQILTPPVAFPLRLMRVPRTVAARVALVGDAAHAIHPLSGHGINLGFQDARALAALLVETPDWKDIGNERLLGRYQRERREETLLMQATTHTLHELFRHNLPGLRPLRNLGMNLTNALPVVKNALVRYAIGAF